MAFICWTWSPGTEKRLVPSTSVRDAKRKDLTEAKCHTRYREIPLKFSPSYTPFPTSSPALPSMQIMSSQERIKSFEKGALNNPQRIKRML